MPKFDKISFSQYQKFCDEFYSHKYPSQRFGQAFMNHFFPDRVNNVLFYMENRKDAVQYIFNRYIDWSIEE